MSPEAKKQPTREQIEAGAAAVAHQEHGGPIPRPNPGSPEAIGAGCTCPRMDNANGRGAPDGQGGSLFWIDSGCPIHTEPFEHED